MSRIVELHPATAQPEIRRTQERDLRLEEYLQYEIEQAISARHPQEELWREAKRQYSAIPRHPYRNTPVPNAPNIEIPLGAIATDAQYAAITDTLYSASPLLTARAQDEFWIEHAKAAQRWVNYCVSNEFDLRDATDHTFFDCCQLGTGGFYIPFVEDIYKHRVFSVRERGPRIIPIAPENIIIPGGSRGFVQRDRWIGIRHWYHPDEMRLRSKFRGWDLSRAIPVASIDWVRRRHEQLGMTDSATHWRELYEVIELYMHYDYNNDGEDLDLLVHWDRSSRKLMDVTFNPYDSRPLELCRYQLRPHLAYGMGIMEMMRPFQDEATEVHNHRLVNMMIANARVWVALSGQVPESMEIWPNKVIEVQQENSIKQLPMGDVYPSSLQAEISITALAERRVGMEGAAPGGSHPRLGTRTPGITALSAMQAQNRRFTPAFDQMRFAAAGAVRQGLLRQRERLKMGDEQVAQHIIEVLGEKDAELVIQLLKEPNFERYVSVEFTAVSPSVNREADRQNAILIGQMFKSYYTENAQLLMAALNPQAPAELIPFAKQVIEKNGELMDRIARTFEQLRDPQTFLVDVGPLLDQAQEQRQQQQGLGGLSQLLAQGVPQGGGNGAAAPEGAPPAAPLTPIQ